jgi:hypothetical protein
MRAFLRRWLRPGRHRATPGPGYPGPGLLLDSPGLPARLHRKYGG